MLGQRTGCKKSGCLWQESQHSRGEAGGWQSGFMQMLASREDGGLLSKGPAPPSSLAQRFSRQVRRGRTKEGFRDRSGSAPQRKADVAQANSWKEALPRGWSLSGIRVGLLWCEKFLQVIVPDVSSRNQGHLACQGANRTIETGMQSKCTVNSVTKVGREERKAKQSKTYKKSQAQLHCQLE